MKLAALLPLAAALPTNTKSGNMNGKYAVSSGGDIGVPFNDDYASKGCVQLLLGQSQAYRSSLQLLFHIRGCDGAPPCWPG